MERDNGAAFSAIILSVSSLVLVIVFGILFAGWLDQEQKRIDDMLKQFHALPGNSRPQSIVTCSMNGKGWLARSDGNCYTEDMPK